MRGSAPRARVTPAPGDKSEMLRTAFRGRAKGARKLQAKACAHYDPEVDPEVAPALAGDSLRCARQSLQKCFSVTRRASRRRPRSVQASTEIAKRSSDRESCSTGFCRRAY